MTHVSSPHGSEVLIRSAVPTFLVATVATTARWYAARERPARFVAMQ
jgi:hypothetical protein